MQRARSADANALHFLASSSRAALSSVMQTWASSLGPRTSAAPSRQIGSKLRSGTLSTTASHRCPPTIIAGNRIIGSPCREKSFNRERISASILHHLRTRALAGPDEPGGPYQIDGADREDHPPGPAAKSMVGHPLEHEGSERGSGDRQQDRRRAGPQRHIGETRDRAEI